jgi:hypothetical protein
LDGASRLEFERQLAETKVKLPAESFERNWQEGQVLTFDRSVELALQAESTLQRRAHRSVVEHIKRTRPRGRVLVSIRADGRGPCA